MTRKRKLEKLFEDVMDGVRFHTGKARGAADCVACQDRLMRALEKAYRKGQRSMK